MPGKSKEGGGLEVKSAFKMKNPLLKTSASKRTPMQANYDSPILDNGDKPGSYWEGKQGLIPDIGGKSTTETLQDISKSVQKGYGKIKEGITKFTSPPSPPTPNGEGKNGGKFLQGFKQTLRKKEQPKIKRKTQPTEVPTLGAQKLAVNTPEERLTKSPRVNNPNI